MRINTTGQSVQSLNWAYRARSKSDDTLERIIEDGKARSWNSPFSTAESWRHGLSHHDLLVQKRMQGVTLLGVGLGVVGGTIAASLGSDLGTKAALGVGLGLAALGLGVQLHHEHDTRNSEGARADRFTSAVREMARRRPSGEASHILRQAKERNLRVMTNLIKPQIAALDRLA